MSDDVIKMYVNEIRKLYQQKAQIVQWARDHEDVINTSQPLADVESLVKRAVEKARRCRDEESLFELDKALYDMQIVLEVLERGWELDKQEEIEVA